MLALRALSCLTALADLLMEKPPMTAETAVITPDTTAMAIISLAPLRISFT
ncbi:hypothetical protein D3C72_2400890 [compost metagenome]